MLETKINSGLELLSRWAEENNMEIRKTKTIYQLFSLQHKNDDFNLTVNNHSLPKSEAINM